MQQYLHDIEQFQLQRLRKNSFALLKLLAVKRVTLIAIEASIKLNHILNDNLNVFILEGVGIMFLRLDFQLFVEVNVL